MARKQREHRKRPIEGTSSARNKKSDFASLSARSHAARNRALHALAAMRRDHKLTFIQAAKLHNVSVRTMRSHLGSALRQDRPGGRISASRADRDLRELNLPGPYGPILKNVRGSRLATELARYLSAVNRFLGGERHALAEWHGKRIAGIELITAGGTLKDLAEKGLLPHSLYRSLSGGAV